MEHDPLLNSIIEGHRAVIEERYEYLRVKERYHPPVWVTEETVKDLRAYFMDYIYPSVADREEINEAFHSLDDHIKHPEHLLRILIDSGSLIFKYGRHLPKILRAALKALHSFRTASQVEEKLAKVAIYHKVAPPFSTEDIQKMISKVPRNIMDDLVESSMELYDVLFDEKLVKNILDIVVELIKKMKKRPEVYSNHEVKGMQLGQSIIQGGFKLFSSFDKDQQQILIETIGRIERDAVDDVFGKSF